MSRAFALQSRRPNEADWHDRKMYLSFKSAQEDLLETIARADYHIIGFHLNPRDETAEMNILFGPQRIVQYRIREVPAP